MYSMMSSSARLPAKPAVRQSHTESDDFFFSSAKVVSEASEVDLHLDETKPISIRHGTVQKGDDHICPHYHPYLELSIRLSGEGSMFADNEKIVCRPYDVFLGSINQPHWGSITSYPMTFIAVYFLPNVLCPMVSIEDSIAIMDRFVAPQSITQRLIHPPRALRERIVQNLQEMAREFDRAEFGHNLKLQTILVSTLVDILRWERKSGRVIENVGPNRTNWRSVALAMAYIREHYDEPIYAKEVAAAAGVSKSQLRVAFRQTVNSPWVKYLEGYRIQRACFLLKEPNTTIAETAMAVGFESLSHFNRSFRAFIGMSPSNYKKRRLSDKTITEFRPHLSRRDS